MMEDLKYKKWYTSVITGPIYVKTNPNYKKLIR